MMESRPDTLWQKYERLQRDHERLKQFVHDMYDSLRIWGSVGGREPNKWPFDEDGRIIDGR